MLDGTYLCHCCGLSVSITEDNYDDYYDTDEDELRCSNCGMFMRCE